MIVDYELSITIPIDKPFVMNTLKRALKNHKPEIINSDQGSHFTNPDYIKLLESSDEKKHWMEKVKHLIMYAQKGFSEP